MQLEISIMRTISVSERQTLLAFLFFGGLLDFMDTQSCMCTNDWNVEVKLSKNKRTNRGEEKGGGNGVHMIKVPYTLAAEEKKKTEALLIINEL